MHVHLQITDSQHVPPMQVKFCQTWAERVLVSNSPIRARRPAALCITQLGATNAAEFCSPANARVARLTEHELVNMSVVQRELEMKKKGPSRSADRLGIQRGVCAYAECPRNVERNYKGTLPARSTYRCQSCNNGNGSYYHLPCFFAVHRCVHEK